MLRWVVIALALASVLFSGQQDLVRAQEAPSLTAAPRDYAPGEILVKFEPGTSDTIADGVHADNGGRVTDVISGIDVQVVSVETGQEQAAVVAYEQDSSVVYAEVNGTAKADNHGKPNDPQVDQQWQYHNTGLTGGTAGADIYAFEAWHITTGSSTVPVAVVDSGISQNHEDLRGKVAKGVNLTALDSTDGHTSSTLDDVYGHGTHVAGSAAAATDNTVGVAGTCGSCALYNVKVLDDTGSGNWREIAEGIRWAADNGAKVISMSLGTYDYSSTLEDAVNYAWDKNAALVASAGNNNASSPRYPAHYDNVVAVGATDYTDAKASFSNHGAWVDVAAPGAGILSTTSNGGYGKLSGTSMAVPHVAGTIGLVWSVFQNATNQAVRDKIESTADRIAGTGTYWTYGRLNACKAVGETSCSRVIAPPADTTPPTVTPPDESLIVPSRLGISSIPVRIGWSGQDAGSGMDHFELERSTNGGAYTPVALPAPMATSMTLSLEPNRTYRFRVRAQDKAGNLSNWSERPSFRLTADQESSTSVTYLSGMWSRSTPNDAYGGSFRYASVSSAKARYTFTGREVAWVSTKGSNRGIADVYVDGAKRATVDLWATSNGWRQVVFRMDLPAGNHTLEIRPTGTKNASSIGKRVDVDAFIAVG